MSPSFLLVKNMVCHRCVTAVEDILVKASIGYHQVIMSQVVLQAPLPPEQKIYCPGILKQWVLNWLRTGVVRSLNK